MEGRLTYRSRNDTLPVIVDLIEKIRSSILNGDVVASHYEQFQGSNILFVHGGLHPAYVDKINAVAKKQIGHDLTVVELSNLINSVLVTDVAKCVKSATATCKGHLSGSMYAAGPERGGSDIGGPFWTGARHTYHLIQIHKSID